MRLPGLVQGIGFGTRPLGFNLHAQRRFGDVWQMKLPTRTDRFVVTSHPDHVKSLFTAKPDDAPSATGESPLRPILGPNSVLTLIGPRHMRERKLLLPPFHGEAVKQYVASETLRSFLRMSTRPIWALVELQNMGRAEPRGMLKLVLGRTDRILYDVIRRRREAGPADGARDVLSLLLAARDEDGSPLSDEELRDELVTLVLAGHETTANSLAWTFERLVRFPEPYERLREAVRSGSRQEADAYVEATIYEGMRARPVIPMVVRLVQRPWRLGRFVVPPRTPVAMSIIGIHHREDLYEEPLVFRPERFLDGDGTVRKPGTYTWIPFGGGIRRCLGAALAMAEQQVVLSAIARRTDLAAVDPAPEAPRQRNVTMIPNHGGRVVVLSKRDG